MKTIKMAFLGGAALSVLTVAAQADDLADLKAQIESLNARVAQMEAAPQVPAGYSLVTISEGARPVVPGLTSTMTPRELSNMSDRSTVISVLPTADAPATTTITWSGYVRAGLVYSDSDGDVNVRARYYDRERTSEWYDVWVGSYNEDRYVTSSYEGTVAASVGGATSTGVITLGETVTVTESYVWLTNDDVSEEDNGYSKLGRSYGDDDIDVLARGQIDVNATTDTAVGEVGVAIGLRTNFDGVGDGDTKSNYAWGWWAMTPELTFGGGYAGSLGNIPYTATEACTCYYIANADVGVNPGDTTQLRLSYASGPFSMAVALEDASINTGLFGDNSNTNVNGDKLGVAGELKYAGDTFSAEIAGDWRGVEIGDDLWQIAAGFGWNWDMFSLAIGGGIGSGPYTRTDSEGIITTAIPYDQDWWAISGLVAVDLSDAWRAELGAGYKEREGDSFDTFALGGPWRSDGVDYDTWTVLGGIYYNPVPQLTLGVEGEWYTTDVSFNTITVDSDGDPLDSGYELRFDDTVDNLTVDFVAQWSF